MSVYKYPCIVGASYFGGFKLLIEWSTGEMCIFDASSHLKSGSGFLYRSEDLFKQFHVDDHFCIGVMKILLLCEMIFMKTLRRVLLMSPLIYS